MVYPMMVNLQIDKVFSREDAGVLGVAQLLNFGVIPFVAFGLGLLFFPGQPTVQMGLLLVALLPTSGMTISWTGFRQRQHQRRHQNDRDWPADGIVGHAVVCKLAVG